MNERNILPSGLRRRAFVVAMSKLTTRKHRVKKTSNKSKTNTIKNNPNYHNRVKKSPNKSKQNTLKNNPKIVNVSFRQLFLVI